MTPAPVPPGPGLQGLKRQGATKDEDFFRKLAVEAALLAYLLSSFLIVNTISISDSILIAVMNY